MHTVSQPMYIVSGGIREREGGDTQKTPGPDICEISNRLPDRWYSTGYYDAPRPIGLINGASEPGSECVAADPDKGEAKCRIYCVLNRRFDLFSTHLYRAFRLLDTHGIYHVLLQSIR